MTLKWNLGASDSAVAEQRLGIPLVRERSRGAPPVGVAVSSSLVDDAFGRRVSFASKGLAFCYFSLGVGSMALALWVGGAANLLYWFAACYFGLCYAYLRKDARVLGKRSDGSFNIWRALLFFPYLFLVRAFFHVKRIGLRKEACWHKVAPDIYLGRIALPDELPPDVRLVVDLTCEYAEPRRIVSTHLYRSLPALNRFIPDPESFRALLDELVDFQAPIFIHCGAGRGRAAAFASALLVARGLAQDVAEAEKRLRAVRPGVRLHEVQRALVTRYTLTAVASPRRNPR
jgi:protein-tyrosine phosphatase